MLLTPAPLTPHPITPSPLHPLTPSPPPPAAASAPSVSASAGSPDRPFLRDFHDRLIAALAKKGITAVNLKEQQWSQRYVIARGADSVTVDIFYNGKNQLTRFMPINPSPTPTPSLISLQDDVGTVLTVEVHP